MTLLRRVLSACHRAGGHRAAKRFSSSAPEDVSKYRSALFSAEQQRQREDVGRIEKMEVRYLGVPQDETFLLNKNISTPYDIAKHLSEMHCKRSALALVDSNTPWDMHRPLVGPCTVQLLHFTILEPHHVNRAFWRTCSFLLGAALQNTFKADAGLQLHSFPSPNIKTGSFVHDISLRVAGWEPNKRELQALSAEMRKLSAQELKIERLDVDLELATKMFHDNPYKLQQLPSIAAHGNEQAVTLYRVGDHVDISRGPMVADSSMLGKCTISAVHQLEKKEGDEVASMYRVQGVALPAGITMNHVMFGVLEERSRKLNPARLPNEPYEESSMEAHMA